MLPIHRVDLPFRVLEFDDARQRRANLADRVVAEKTPTQRQQGPIMRNRHYDRG